MQEYRVLESNQYVGQKYFDVFVDMKKKFNTIVVGLSKKVNGEWQLLTNPGEEVLINANDYLILMCNGSAKKDIVKAFGVPEGRII